MRNPADASMGTVTLVPLKIGTQQLMERLGE